MLLPRFALVVELPRKLASTLSLRFEIGNNLRYVKVLGVCLFGSEKFAERKSPKASNFPSECHPEFCSEFS